MKNQGVILLLLSAAYAEAQKPVFTKAKIEAVSVYRNSAELKNTAYLSIPQGMSEIVISNIAGDINPKSLQIGLNNSKVSILSSQFTTDYTSELKTASDPETKKIYEAIQSTETLIAKSKIELNANLKTLELLDKNQTLLTGGNSSNISQLGQLIEFYTSERIRIGNKISDIEKNETELQQKLIELKNTLPSVKGKNNSGTGFIILKVISSEAANLKLDISYLSGRVLWTPHYEIRGVDIRHPLEVTLKAKLIQKTGIDWKKVKLNLINGFPSENNTAPVLEPWFLYTGSPAQRNHMSEEVLEEVVPTYYAEAKKADMSSDFKIEPNQLNISYETDIAYDVLSNGREHLINLYRQEIPAEFQYLTIPNYREEAFLIAKIRDFGKYVLISAPAHIIFENMYAGETHINAENIEADLNITIGNDRRISVKKENIKDKSGDKFLSSNKTRVVTYDLIVRNNKKDNIDIEIKDRIPISNEEVIKVELLECSGAKKEPEQGFLTWNVKLTPSETKKLRVSYKITFPKNLIIHNL